MIKRMGAAALFVAVLGLGAACGGDGRAVVDIDEFEERFCDLNESDAGQIGDSEVQELRGLAGADAEPDAQDEALAELVRAIEEVRDTRDDFIGQIPQPEGDAGAEWIADGEEARQKIEDQYNEAIADLNALDGDDIIRGRNSSLGDAYFEAMNKYDAADPMLYEWLSSAPAEIREIFDSADCD